MKSRDYAILILFFLTPYAFINAGILHTGHLYFFIMAALVSISLMQRNTWLSLFFIYAVCWQLVICLDGLSNFTPARHMQIRKGLSQIVYLLAGVSIYATVLKAKLRNETFYNVICISAILQCIWSISQLIGHDPLVYILKRFIEVRRAIENPYAIVGTLGNPNFVAAYLAISLPFFFRVRRPFFYRILIKKWTLYLPNVSWCYFIPVIATILFLSRTAAAVIPAVIGTAFYYRNLFESEKRTKWLLLSLFGLLALGYAIYDQTIFTYMTSVRECRYFAWWQAMKQFDSVGDWLFGFGPGASWGHRFAIHNEWLTILFLYGLTGLICIGGFIRTIDRSDKMLFTSFIIICLNMIPNYPLHLAPSVFLIIVVLGLMERRKHWQTT